MFLARGHGSVIALPEEKRARARSVSKASHMAFEGVVPFTPNAAVKAALFGHMSERALGSQTVAWRLRPAGLRPCRFEPQSGDFPTTQNETEGGTFS